MLKEFLNINTSDVVREISALDDMYQGNEDHYFHVGRSALKCIKLALLSSGKESSDVKQILDFPCGYGRVLRVLKVAFPAAQMTACDLDRNGVDFCKENFDAAPVYSDKNLENVVLQKKFDLIWVGSLFTHLDKIQWPLFLDFFNKSLNPGGILAFTTQGRCSAGKLRNSESTYGLETTNKINKLLNNFDNDGFGYSSYFHSDDYGISLSSPSFVLNMLEQQHNLRIVMCLEKGWDNHQDVIACVKE